jgi:hypothetical protein
MLAVQAMVTTFKNIPLAAKMLRRLFPMSE